MGWGMTSPGSKLPTALRMARLNVISNAQCQGFYGSFVRDTQICTWTAKTDFCTVGIIYCNNIVALLLISYE